MLARMPRRTQGHGRTFHVTGAKSLLGITYKKSVFPVLIGHISQVEIVKGLTLPNDVCHLPVWERCDTVPDLFRDLSLLTVMTQIQVFSQVSHFKTYFVTHLGLETCDTVVTISNLTCVNLRRVLLVQIETCEIFKMFWWDTCPF